MILDKSLITSIQPSKRVLANVMQNKYEVINVQIEKNIAQNERKITSGMKRAQAIKMK